jgi:AraC-like DNA-binding protein
MTGTVSWLSGTVVALALASVLLLLARRRKSEADVLFAVFCGSLAATMLRPGLEGSPGWMLLALALGGCATCNVYWLVARALFRGQGGVRREHIAIALGVALLIVAYRIAESGGPQTHWPTVLDSLLTLASSTLLLLAFGEALRGWSPAMPRAEKRLRIVFMAIYAGCVLTASVIGALAKADPAWTSVYRAVVPICALIVLMFTHAALLLRRRQPLSSPVSMRAPVVAKPEDRRLAEAIVRQFEEHAVYRQSELKVADLAQLLDSAEHKVSRVVTQVLGERNFNQLVNRYRIAHACRLLQADDEARSVLEISAGCGFASLGPFNRAFKAAMGCTPTAYRSACRSASNVPDAANRAASSSACIADVLAPDV